MSRRNYCLPCKHGECQPLAALAAVFQGLMLAHMLRDLLSAEYHCDSSMCALDVCSALFLVDCRVRSRDEAMEALGRGNCMTRLQSESTVDFLSLPRIQS